MTVRIYGDIRGMLLNHLFQIWIIIYQEKYQPLFYYTTAESIGDVLMYSVRSAVNEWKKNGDTDEEVSKWGNFTIKWKDLGHNNYEIYVMWGGKGIRN